MCDSVEGHLPALRAYAISLTRNHADAEDLVQETLERAIKYVSSYECGTNMRAWLFTIMRNRFYTNVAKQARERTGSEDCVSNVPSVPPKQEWHIQGTEIMRAIDDLPTHYRDAIILVVVIGESYIDAAKLLECEIGTIKSRINRGC